MWIFSDIFLHPLVAQPTINHTSGSIWNTLRFDCTARQKKKSNSNLIDFLSFPGLFSIHNTYEIIWQNPRKFSPITGSRVCLLNCKLHHHQHPAPHRKLSHMCTYRIHVSLHIPLNSPVVYSESFGNPDEDLLLNSFHLWIVNIWERSRRVNVEFEVWMCWWCVAIYSR